jgi:hypothetical protein
VQRSFPRGWGRRRAGPWKYPQTGLLATPPSRKGSKNSRDVLRSCPEQRDKSDYRPQGSRDHGSQSNRHDEAPFESRYLSLETCNPSCFLREHGTKQIPATAFVDRLAKHGCSVKRYRVPVKANIAVTEIAEWAQGK